MSRRIRWTPLHLTKTTLHTYETRAWKTLDSVRGHLSGREAPVILLEGTRQLPDDDRPTLVALVDARWLQYVLPQRHMGQQRLASLAYTVSYDQLSATEGNRVAEATSSATPANQRLVNHYQQTSRPTAGRARAAYLLRDTLKVLGSVEAGLAPATMGVFYVNEQDPLGGGTGHTIRVCLQHNVPVLTQNHWRAWLGQAMVNDNS